MAINHDNNFRCWLWFSNNRQEELYEVIQAMIQDKVNEMIPQLIDELFKKIHNSYEIQPIINGQVSANLKDLVAEMIIEGFKK